MADQSIQIGGSAKFPGAKANAVGAGCVANYSSTDNAGANIVAINITSSLDSNEPHTRALNHSFESHSQAGPNTPVDHTQKAIHCFRMMNDQLQQDILDVGVGHAQFLTNTEVIRRWPKKRDEKISKELEYACTSWAEHLIKADKNNERLVKKLEKFVHKHLLHWIEALSWINKLDSANLSLRDGIAFLESKLTSSNSLRLLSEGQRLISNFGDLIGQTALHTYRSALPLTPNESLLYHKYSRETRINLCQVLSWWPEDSHGIITRSQHQQPVNHIVFSCHPSAYFASWSGEVVTIWNSTDGTSCANITDKRIALADNFNAGASSRESSVFLYNFLDQNSHPMTLTTSAPVLRIALSSDGRRLAAGSSDGTIRLWDVAKGLPIRDIDGFECDNQRNCQFVFSPNGPAGARLVFSSVRGGLEFRNAIDGERITNLYYPPAMHFNLAFSSDGSRLASLVKEKDGKHILKVWNAVNGTSIGASAESVGSVLAISANGLLIATGGDGHSLQLYCGGQNCGDHLSSYTPPDLDLSNRINYLSFSQDDDLLMIGFADAGSALYDVKKCFIVAMIPKHDPSAASFSPDRTRLAIGYRDGTLDLWDISSLKTSRDMGRTKSAFVSILAFSPDCLRLASGFEDGTIRLWDTECTSQPLAIHRSHSVKITALAFRLDGALFASGAADGTIRMWDSNGFGFTDYCKFPNPGELTSVAFSGMALAAATVYETILWDIRTWKNGLLRGSTFLSFSNPENDQSRLLASFNKDVVVWDIFANRCTAQFQFGDVQTVEKLAFTSDNSQLAVIVGRDDGSESFCLFDLKNKLLRYLQANEYSRFCLMPRWLGIPVWLQYSSGNYIITGFSSEDSDRFSDLKMVVLPKHFVVNRCRRSYGSRMFALPCEDGRILLFRSLY